MEADDQRPEGKTSSASGTFGTTNSKVTPTRYPSSTSQRGNDPSRIATVEADSTNTAAMRIEYVVSRL